MLLSSWHSHCESSLGSSDECSTSAGWPLTYGPSQWMSPWAACSTLSYQVRVRSHTHDCKSEYPYIRVPRSMSLHVFNRHPFTLIRVLYEYGLPVNFTCTSIFCAGHVFIQPVWSEQHKICINLINTGYDAYLTSLIMSLLNCSLLGVHDSKIINDVVLLFRKALTRLMKLTIAQFLQ